MVRSLLMKRSAVIFSLCCGLVAAGVRGQTNFVPKAPPRSYDARVQMHRVPLNLNAGEKDQEDHFWLPKTGGARVAVAQGEQYVLPQDGGHQKSAKEVEDEKEREERLKAADVKTILGVDEPDRAKLLQPQWDGLARDVMKSRTAAAEKNARSRSRTADGRDRDGDKNVAKNDSQGDRGKRSYTSWLDDKNQDEADGRNPTAIRGFDGRSSPTIVAGDSPVRMPGDIASELRGGDIAAMKNYNSLLDPPSVPSGAGFDAKAAAEPPVAAYRSDVFSSQAGIAAPALRSGDAIFTPRADAGIMAMPQRDPVFSAGTSPFDSQVAPVAGSGGGLFTRDSVAPVHPAAATLPAMGPTDGFRKPPTQPW